MLFMTILSTDLSNRSTRSKSRYRLSNLRKRSISGNSLISADTKLSNVTDWNLYLYSSLRIAIRLLSSSSLLMFSFGDNMMDIESSRCSCSLTVSVNKKVLETCESFMALLVIPTIPSSVNNWETPMFSVCLALCQHLIIYTLGERFHSLFLCFVSKPIFINLCVFSFIHVHTIFLRR